VFPKWAWSRSREQFLHCVLRKFGHSKSSVYRWYTQLDRRRFVYDTYKTMKATRSRHGLVHMLITHCLQLNLQLHNFDLFRTCHTSSLCTVAWQLARFQLTRRIALSLGDIWASCYSVYDWHWICCAFGVTSCGLILHLRFCWKYISVFVAVFLAHSYSMASKQTEIFGAPCIVC